MQQHIAFDRIRLRQALCLPLVLSISSIFNHANPNGGLRQKTGFARLLREPPERSEAENQRTRPFEAESLTAFPSEGINFLDRIREHDLRLSVSILKNMMAII
jgi:hypothetical protein